MANTEFIVEEREKEKEKEGPARAKPSFKTPHMPPHAEEGVV